MTNRCARRGEGGGGDQHLHHHGDGVSSIRGQLSVTLRGNQGAERERERERETPRCHNMETMSAGTHCGRALRHTPAARRGQQSVHVEQTRLSHLSHADLHTPGPFCINRNSFLALRLHSPSISVPCRRPVIFLLIFIPSFSPLVFIMGRRFEGLHKPYCGNMKRKHAHPELQVRAVEEKQR